MITPNKGFGTDDGGCILSLIIASLVIILCLEMCEAKAQSLVIKIDKPTYILATAPDIVSRHEDIRKYYFYINGCWVWKSAYLKNPRFYYYRARRCYE